VTDASRPDGTCTLRREGDQLSIVQADPRVLISEELVEDLRRGECEPHVTMADDVVTIHADRDVVYRLIEHVPAWRAWVAEWPD